MKIIVMGTGPFAVPSFQWLLDSDHDIPLLVTRPIDDPGKRRKSQANPMQDLASQRGVDVMAPPSINDPGVIEALQHHQADLFLVCDYGQILKDATLGAARLGGINLHGSLLPRYRGAAPINWAIYNGEVETGVTVILVTPKLDGGPMLVQRTLAIGAGETAAELEPRMANEGVGAVWEAIAMLETWDGHSTIGTPQDPAKVTQAPRLHKRQGAVDWSRSAIALFNQFRAFQPWPGCFTFLDPGGKSPLRLILQHVSVADDEPPAGLEPGRVAAVSDDSIDVVTGQGVLRIHELQPAGKRVMAVGEFLRGRRIDRGDRLGPV